MHRPVIDISLSSQDGTQSCFITSLCTLDSLTGTARITPLNNVPFDTVEIALMGISRTLVDRMSPGSAVPKARCAVHKFLDLRQPNVENDLPADKILRAGMVYTIPFNFVIPDRMSVNLCQHKVKSAEVREHHHALPPSLGDSEVSGHGETLLDDMAPQMCRIEYSVSVRVIQRALTHGRKTIPAEKLHKLRITPALEEQPPLDTDDLDGYCRHEEKKIRRGLLGRTIGTVCAEVKQPQSFILPAIEAENRSAITTTPTVMLRFDPDTPDIQPPRLGRLSAKLNASTFFASKPMSDFPSRAKYVYDASQGLYAETLNLNCRSMESVQWTKHEPEAAGNAQAARHDSVVSIKSTASNTRSGKPFYTAHFIVPTTLPTNKSFVPTFHSCLASRTYALELSINFSSQSRGPNLFNNIDLRVPVQIVAAPSRQHLARRASYTAEIDEQYEDYCALESLALPMVHGIPTLLAAHEGPPAYAPHGLDKGPLPLYS